ncbi:CU044_5270 family protein [Rhodococcus sp. ACT016]|uniref:CU044_5270 family protein n=1 Tax=Rhodococcus sp. ACT016 TaxID=3134808 RepID=UPI003D2DEF25
MNETISDEQLDADLCRLGGDVPELPEGLAARIDNLMADRRIDTLMAESRTPKSRVWIAVAAAVTLLAGGVVVGTSVVSSNPGADSTAGPSKESPLAADPTRMTVDALLLASSEKLASTPSTRAAFTFVEEHAWWMSSGDGEYGTFAYLGENILQTWIPADTNDEWLQRRSVSPHRQWVVGNEEIAGKSALGPGWPEGEFRGRRGQFFPSAGDDAVPASFANPSAEYLDGLPDDPTALYEKLRAESGSDAQLLSDVASGLRSGLVSNHVTSNIYRALIALQTLEVTDGQANLDGRIGTGVGVVNDGRRTEIIIDPVTGEFIGQRVVTLDGYDDIPPGTAVEFSSVTRLAVDAAGETVGSGTR